MNKLGLWQVLILTVLAASHAKKRPLSITIKNFTCVYPNRALVEEFNCYCGKQKGQTTLNVRFKLAQALKQFRIVVDFDVLKRDNSRIKIQHLNLDGCLYLTPACKHTFSGNIIDGLFGISNLPRKCPILAGTVYEVQNYTITLERIPIVSSSLSYLTKIRLLRQKEVVADLYIEASAMN